MEMLMNAIFFLEILFTRNIDGLLIYQTQLMLHLSEVFVSDNKMDWFYEIKNTNEYFYMNNCRIHLIHWILCFCVEMSCSTPVFLILNQ